MKFPWFRWYSGTWSDPKLRLVARHAKKPLADVITTWAICLEHASDADPRGQLQNVDFDAVDCCLDWPEGHFRLIYGHLQKRGLIDESGAIVAWSKRQPKREREDDNSTERVKALRERQRHATPRNANGAQGTPRGEGDESKGNKKGESAPDGAPPPPTPPEYLKFITVERPDIKNPQRVWANFWDSRSASGRTLASWRIWVRKEHADKEQPPSVLDPDSLAGVEAEALGKGLGRWDQLRERFEVYKARVRATVSAGSAQ